MLKFNPDYKSRFRILKGGKISLVVSALLVSSSVMVTNANALDIVATTGTASVVTDNNGATQSINVVGDVTITNAQALDLQDMDHAIFTVNSGVTVTSTVTDTTAAALYFNGTDLSNTIITNSGTLEATGSGYSLGMRIFDVALNNSTILNAEGATITASSSGNKAFGIEIDDPIISSTIENAGDMNVTSTSSSATGISLGNVTSSSVTNSGTLDVSGTSVVGISATVLGDSNITNSGSITVNATSQSGGSYGIRLDNSNADNTTITNSGDITVISKNAGTGIYVNGTTSGLEVTNSGTINLDGVEGWLSGIEINAYLDSGTREAIITNSGTISANVTDGGSTFNIGIDIQQDMNDASQVINDANGLISLTNDSGSNLFGIRMNADMYDTSSITNAGTISINSGEDGFGIYGFAMYDNSSLTNTNVITVDAVGIGYGIKIDDKMENTSSITNAGTITVNAGDAGHGININRMADNTSVLNSGTIDVSAVGLAVGIEVQEMMLDTESPYSPLASISNSGTITADGLFSSAGIFVSFTYDYSDSKQFNITNSGTITATVNGEANWYGFALIGGDNTALNVTNTGVINGNIHLTNNSTLTNAGTISLPYNANSDAGYDTFVGTFVNSGTLTIGLLTDGTTTTHSQLSANDATFNTGSILKVNVLEASSDEGLLVGGTLEDVVKAYNSLTINDLTITDNSALLNFEYVKDENTIDLNIVEGTTIFDATIAGGGNGNTQNAAGALQAIQEGGTPSEMTAFFSGLGALATDEEVADAIESTTPVASTAAVGANSQIARNTQGIVQMRQSANVRNGRNSGDPIFGEKNLWIKPFGSIGAQDDKDGMNGFDIQAAGLGFGVDGEYATNQKIGLALFYTQANVDVNNMSQTSDLGVFSALVYGNIPMLDDKTNFLYQLGYAWQKTDTERYIATTSQTASAGFTTNTASIDLKVIRDYEVTNNFLLQPIVEATYRNFTSPNYTETGAGGLNLNAYKYSSDELIVGGGVLAHYELDRASKIIGNINLGYDLYNKEETITSSYSGASEIKFGTNGIDNGRWNYDLGIGYERDVKEGHSINFSYNYQGQGTAFETHILSMKYVLTF